MDNVLAILLAGGAGERLFPLTRNTAKPAVPFGGIYRIIDFTLSNCINSGIRRVFIMAQYKSLDLTRHVRQGWDLFSGELAEFIEVIPPMKRVHDDWYLGTADSVYQNLASIESETPSNTFVLSGDQIYKMNYHEMLDWHREQDADVTIATIRLPPDQATHFGVADIAPDYRIRGFEEKPKHGNPIPSAFDSEMISASMGIYLFKTEVLAQAVREDADSATSSHDFGRDVIPSLIPRAKVVAYDFRDLNAKKVRYWRDLGTVDAFYEANMDLVAVTPEFNLYDKTWPIRTALVQGPPAKFVFAQEGRRMGVALDSIVSNGVIVSGGRISRCILSPGVRVNSYCDLADSIVLHNAEIGRYCRIRRAIIDANVKLPEGLTIGENPEADRAAGYHVTESGIVVVSTGMGVPQAVAV